MKTTTKTRYIHTLEVGDIMHYSWGYDQTNCQYYQVIACTDHTATIREIGYQTVPGSEGFMSESVVPVKGAFLESEKPMTKRVRPGNYITIESYGSCSKWEGDQNYHSWYA